MAGRNTFASQIALVAIIIIGIFFIINYTSTPTADINHPPDMHPAAFSSNGLGKGGAGGGLREVLIAKHLHFLYNIGDHEHKFYSQNGEDGK